MNKAIRLSLAVFASLCMGSAVGFVITVLSSPGLYTNPRFILGYALYTVPVWAFLYLGLPMLVLALYAFRRTGRLSLTLCTLVPTLWLFLIFLWWAYKPWRYYGTFPWHGFTRHFLSLLPVVLSAGWLFWRTLSPNPGLHPIAKKAGSG